MIEDGIYLHTLFGIAYMVKGDNMVMVMTDDHPYWTKTEMSREQMQILLDNGLIKKK
ncbi:hypothetical protein [Escherichia coli]|uniref:hypothetical protein n=1 Tax=Escherichia coli TaxID=562 RepID=UPI0018E4B5C9|nr:hypothetical protein [Escherichia coli]